VGLLTHHKGIGIILYTGKKGKIVDEANITQILTKEVLADPGLWIGLIGVALGAGLTLFSNIIFHWIKEKPNRDLDNQRMEILKIMLEDDKFEYKWRNISTLSAVIGASKEETKRLLIKVGARGSETDEGKWGLISKHPLPNIE